MSLKKTCWFWATTVALSALLLCRQQHAQCAQAVQSLLPDAIGGSVKTLGMADAVVALPNGGMPGQNPAATAFQPGILEFRGFHHAPSDRRLEQFGYHFSSNYLNGIGISTRLFNVTGFQGGYLDAEQTIEHDQTAMRHSLRHTRFFLGTSVQVSREWSLGATLVLHQVTRQKSVLQTPDPITPGGLPTARQRHQGTTVEAGLLGYPTPQWSLGFWTQFPTALQAQSQGSLGSVSGGQLLIPARAKVGAAWLPVAEASEGHWFPGGHLLSLQIDLEKVVHLSQQGHLRPPFVVVAEADAANLDPQAAVIAESMTRSDVRVHQGLLVTPRLGFETILLRYPDAALSAWAGTYWQPSLLVKNAPPSWHGTAGLRALLWALVLEFGVDLAPGYSNWSSGLGVAFDI